MAPGAGFKANLARRVITALVVLPVLLAGLLLGPPLLGAAIVLIALGFLVDRLRNRTRAKP